MTGLPGPSPYRAMIPVAACSTGSKDGSLSQGPGSIPVQAPIWAETMAGLIAAS